MYQEEKSVLAERMTELRKKHNFTQEDIAKYLDCNRATVANYENGKRQPDYNTLIKLAQKYGVSTDYLLGLTDVTTADRDLKFICDYTGLSEKSVQILHFFKDSECITPTTNLLLESEGGAILRELGYYLEELPEEEAKEICIDRSKIDKIEIQEYETIQLLSRLENYLMLDKSSDNKILSVTKTGKIISLSETYPEYSKNTFTSFEDLISVKKIRQNNLVEKVLFDDVIDGIKELKRQVNPNGKHNKEG